MKTTELRKVVLGARFVLGFALAVLVAGSGPLVGQAQVQTSPAAQAPAPGSAAAAINAEASEQASTLSFFNRPIVVLRARVLGRLPNERAAAAERVLDDLIAQQITGPVESRAFAGGTIITVASRGVLVLAPPDVDELSDETLPALAARTVARLQRALKEAGEARTPRILLRGAARAAALLLVGLLVLWGLVRVHRAVASKLLGVAEQKLAKTGIADVGDERASRLLDFQRGIVKLVFLVLDLVVTYGTVTFVFRQFSYTRPWGDSLGGFLLTTVENLALAFVSAMPGLFTAAVIFLLARFLVRLMRLWFDAVEQGRIQVGWLYPETAQPTRRLMMALVWLFAIVVAYPYLPGSQTDAFKGVSVFLGLMVTFGSSGLVSQIVGGFMITFSRALRAGDYVRVGDVEGTVMQLGVLSIKIKTLRREEVTVPNAVVVAQTTTDYSRTGDTEGVLTPTSVTIGYDAPWRQVQALLLLAAERTPGLRQEPKPVVIQAELQDFYVKYSLFVSLERQQTRFVTLNALHANIQDLFNEYGVQIMSPNYVLDPAAAKVVPKKDWFAAPARPDPPQHDT